ncbi:MAG: GntR family transcriptional regulator [Ktedonobacteraceae bacterium]|nr:GntR family transcriptional regulator [Ktedonobacteraceae bacterium]
MIEQNYKPGDMLPTEPELEKMFGVSRMTVRLAMDALVEEGLVIKRQGRGTFVQQPKITHDLKSITSWTQQIRSRGLIPRTISTKIERVAPSRKLMQFFQIDEQEPLICIKRVRYASDEPMCIMINYLREKDVPGLLEKGLQRESLYETLEQEYGIVIAEAQDIVEAREAAPAEAEELHIKAYSPVLFVTRYSYLPNNQPLEVVYLTSRADRYQYHIILHPEQDRGRV